MSKTLFIGATVADRIIRISHPVQLAASNICHSNVRPGGVSANTARSFVTSGGAAHLLSALGADEMGSWLKAELATCGITLDNLPTSPPFPTASYSAVHGPDGELVIGLAEMDIFEHIDASGHRTIRDHMSQAQQVFIDASLNEHTLHRIGGSKLGQFLAAAAVSPAKSMRLKPAAPYIDFLFCNRREAAALTGTAAENECHTYLAGLREIGFRAGIITDGASPLYLFDSDGHEMIAVPQIAVQDVVNGAGDALAGGVFHGIVSGMTNRAAITGPGFVAVSRHILQQG